MKPVPFADIPRNLWDAVSEASSQAWLFHTHAWIEIEAARFVRENHSFALMAGERLVAIQPLYLSDHESGTGGERLLHCGIHRHTGLALHPALTEAEARAARSASMARILAIADESDVDRVQLNSHNLAPENMSPGRRDIPFWVEEYGFHLGLNFGPAGMAAAPGMSTCNADQVVELDLDEEALFARLDPSCRRAVRKAQSLGMALDVVNDASAIDRYFEIARASAQRTAEQLPSIDYYHAIRAKFAPAGSMVVLFARRAEILAAGLIVLIFKGSMNFLAGASLPDELPNRVNDFLHWQAMLWAKRAGLRRYRLGPSFPEVPADWPIARVSRFKTKFGGSSRPVIQGSLFRYPEKYAENAANQIALLCARKESMRGVQTAGSNEHIEPDPLKCQVIEHHLALMGWHAKAPAPALVTLCPARPSDIGAARAALAAGDVVVAVQPNPEFCAAFGVNSRIGTAFPPCVLEYASAAPRPLARGAIDSIAMPPTSTPRLRSLHVVTTFHSASADAVLVDQAGSAVWLWQPVLASGILFVGTDLAADLVRYRQGDPALAEQRDAGERWGYAGERPNYLFEAQREGELPGARHADEWAWALARTLASLTGTKLCDILPGGARGAIIITGDDDQASLDCYARQLALLGDAPITYFLHPLTKHTRRTLSELERRRGRVDLGIHPDALDCPKRYPERFAEQARWFASLVGHPAESVRNHGFLNDGYWGHLPSWINGGVRISSNLPGFDGNVLNGSLLPGRLVHEGRLTEHWSILTLIGDGAIFVNDWDAARATRCVHDAADCIRASDIPGVMVLNLHPENAERAEPMHRAALEVIQSGFVPWTLRDCLAWFSGRSLASAS